MYHSVTFVDAFDSTQRVNTWDDWHLIPTSPPVVKPAQPNQEILSIPGLNGQYDISALQTGYVTYKNRTGNFDFYYLSKYWGDSWANCLTTVASFLNGRRCKCYLEDDPTYYYEGYFYVKDWTPDRTNSKISISYDVYPYKKEERTSLDDWLWDSFNFERDVIRETSDISVGSTLVIVGSDEPIVPSFIFSGLSGSATVKHRWLDGPNPSTYSQNYIVSSNGTYRFSGIVIRQGRNELVIGGNSGRVSIDYRGGLF